MLAGLMSRWMMPFWWAACDPWATCIAKFQHFGQRQSCLLLRSTASSLSCNVSPFQQLHHNERLTFVLAELVNGTDVAWSRADVLRVPRAPDVRTLSDRLPTHSEETLSLPAAPASGLPPCTPLPCLPRRTAGRIVMGHFAANHVLPALGATSRTVSGYLAPLKHRVRHHRR